MNLSVSNIAWNREENKNALAILKQNGINAIDIAPNLLFNSIENLTKEEINSKYEEYKKEGFKIIAMQSLLYGIPPYSIFEEKRDFILKHLGKICFIARELRIKNLIFGSPKNREIKNKNTDNINIAIDFFRKLSDIADTFKLNICLEANPTEYNCNFIINTFEAIDFIKKVNKKNFSLNLDTSTIILNKDNFRKVLDYSIKHIQHIHISSPYIKEIFGMNHEKISNLLRLYNYQGYVSLEMKPNITENNLENLEKNVKIFKKYYS